MENPFDEIDKRFDRLEKLIYQLKSIMKPIAPETQYYSMEGALEYFRNQGLQMSKATLYTKTSHRIIPFYKNGKSLRFEKRDLDNYLARGKTKTIEENREGLKDIFRKANQ